MLYSQYYLKDAIVKINNTLKTIKEDTNIVPLRSKLYGFLFEMAIACEESWHSFNQYRYREARDSANRCLELIRDTEEPMVIKNALTELMDMFPDDNEFQNLSFNHFVTNAYRATTVYRPLEKYNVSKIATVLGGIQRNMNIIDPRCKNGENLEALKDTIKTCTTYGIEAEPERAAVAKTRVDRVAAGALHGSKISNDAFDAMLLEPPISWNLGDTILIGKAEKEYIYSTLKYLREDGVAIIVIPYFRMYKDMCLLFAKNFKDVQVRKLSGPDFFDKGLVAIVGKKNYTREPDPDIYHQLRMLYKIEDIPELTAKEFDRIPVPGVDNEIELFRGSILDTDEMLRIVETSGCVDAFWQSQAVEKLSDSTKQPLLPFNIGQIGLVLTSGCLDGVIDEGDGNYHVIKGRVSKKSTVERNGVGENIEVIETISNRVEINVLLPNGEHKILA